MENSDAYAPNQVICNCNVSRVLQEAIQDEVEENQESMMIKEMMEDMPGKGTDGKIVKALQESSLIFYSLFAVRITMKTFTSNFNGTDISNITDNTCNIFERLELDLNLNGCLVAADVHILDAIESNSGLLGSLCRSIEEKIQCYGTVAKK